jgi:hypothetical protein
MGYKVVQLYIFNVLLSVTCSHTVMYRLEPAYACLNMYAPYTQELVCH